MEGVAPCILISGVGITLCGAVRDRASGASHLGVAPRVRQNRLALTLVVESVAQGLTAYQSPLIAIPSCSDRVQTVHEPYEKPPDRAADWVNGPVSAEFSQLVTVTSR